MRARRFLVAGLVATLSCSTLAGAAFMRGSSGPDRLIGTKHADTLVGRAGRDLLKGRRGFDQLRGGRGNDRIRARDGEADTINCGRGANDKVVLDLVEDGVYDCERVVEPES
jgi:Ca2+-binding RTX toxin-like protein